ncbi:MAG TPA: hypothetical protein VME42_16165 [Steroidobacteraceae bacterium]|nr:hypothetical protein [Steroidobacteraceae bacterium]
MPLERSNASCEAAVPAAEGSAAGRANKFSNCRDWRSFLSSLQGPPACPSVAAALQAGRVWLARQRWLDGYAAVSDGYAAVSEEAVRTYRWLVGGGSLIAGSGKTLGV